MARIVRFHETGGPEVLRIEEVPPSPPGEGEVRIAVKVIGLTEREDRRHGMRAGAQPAGFLPYPPKGYPAVFHAFTPPPSALAFLYPWARYSAARPAALASPGQPQ